MTLKVIFLSILITFLLAINGQTVPTSNTTEVSKPIVGIIDGRNTTIADRSHVVSILITCKGQTGGCSGSVITSKYVLTAAHCAFNVEIFKIFPGDCFKGVSITSKLAYIHPNYVNNLFIKGNFEQDAAVIVLENSILEFGKQIIPLATSLIYGISDFDFLSIGCGRDDCNKKSLPAQAKIACLVAKDFTSGGYNQFGKKNVIFGFGINSSTYSGDSGSGILVEKASQYFECFDPNLNVLRDFLLYGIVSFGAGCGAESYGGYTTLDSVKTFVDKPDSSSCTNTKCIVSSELFATKNVDNIVKIFEDDTIDEIFSCQLKNAILEVGYLYAGFGGIPGLVDIFVSLLKAAIGL